MVRCIIQRKKLSQNMVLVLRIERNKPKYFNQKNYQKLHLLVHYLNIDNYYLGKTAPGPNYDVNDKYAYNKVKYSI